MSLKEKIQDIVEDALVAYTKGGYTTMYAGTGLYGEQAADQIMAVLREYGPELVHELPINIVIKVHQNPNAPTVAEVERTIREFFGPKSDPVK